MDLYLLPWLKSLGDKRHITVADLGVAYGPNSIIPSSHVIHLIRQHNPDIEISVCLTDQPRNDWTRVAQDVEYELPRDEKIFVSLIPRYNTKSNVESAGYSL